MKSTTSQAALLGVLSAVAMLVVNSAALSQDKRKPELAAKPATLKLPVPGQPQAPPPAPPLADAKPAPPEAKEPPSEIQQQFCLNNAATAADARVAWQAAKLVDLETQINKRIADLEAKRAEYMEWFKKREDAMKRAEDSVVAIYAKMRPEAAALQLAAMDDAMAAALLAKLTSRNASAILNEMEPGRAARLTNAMVGPASNADRKKS